MPHKPTVAVLLLGLMQLASPRARATALAEVTGEMPADSRLAVDLAGLGGRLDVTLYFRATSAPGGPLQAGWGLRLRGNRAYFVKVTRGVVRRHGGIVYLLGASGRRRLALRLLLHGEHVVAVVYGRQLKRRFATLALRAGPPAAAKRYLARVVGAGEGTRVAARRLCAPPSGSPSPRKPARVFATLAGAGANAGQLLEQTARQRVLRLEVAELERLLCHGARLLFVSARRPWKYVGAGAAYLTLRRGQPAPRRRDGRLDLTRSYKNPAMVARLLEGWSRRHPRKTRLSTVGRSHGGRPLQALYIGDAVRAGDPRPTVLLNGGHHGTEPLSVELVLDAIEQLLGDSPLARRARRELVICAVPLVNPDGLQHYLEVSLQMGRKNGRDHNGDGLIGVYEGVDLNRNYPFGWRAKVQRRDTKRRLWHYYRGPAPASEPEVKAMIALAARERFVASLSYHSGAVALHVPYTVVGARAPIPDEAGAVAAELVRALGAHPMTRRRFRLHRTISSVSGSDQDYYRHAHGTLALLVESSRRTPRPGKQLAAVVAGLRPSWRALLARYLDGPTIWGHVRDARGRPVEAEVRLAEVTLRAGERWTSRPRDGRFDRILARPGSYTLRIIAAGYPPIERAVRVGRRQRLRVEIRLPPR